MLFTSYKIIRCSACTGSLLRILLLQRESKVMATPRCRHDQGESLEQDVTVEVDVAVVGNETELIVSAEGGRKCQRVRHYNSGVGHIVVFVDQCQCPSIAGSGEGQRVVLDAQFWYVDRPSMGFALICCWVYISSL